jgi:hypothetical protein
LPWRVSANRFMQLLCRDRRAVEVGKESGLFVSAINSSHVQASANVRRFGNASAGTRAQG